MGVWINMREVCMDNGKMLFWRYSRGHSRGGVTTGRAGERASFSLHAYPRGSVRSEAIFSWKMGAALFSSLLTAGKSWLDVEGGS